MDWTQHHYYPLLSGYIFLYILAVAISIPGATFLTIIAGFLFGPLVGTVAVVFSATLGSFIVFLAVKLAFREWFKKQLAG